MKLCTAVVVSFLATTPIALASESIPVPDVRVGDRWVVQGMDASPKDNWERSWKVRRDVTKVEGTIATWKYENLPPSQPATGENRYDLASQALLRGIVSGKPEPAKFPLAVGNEWTHEYAVKGSYGVARYEFKARVVGWEEVTVPAGTFRALRIEHKGTWSRDTDFSREGINRTLTAPVEMTLWYAPAAKSVVKRIRTESSAWRGISFRGEEELVEFLPGN